jgi:ATP-dependent 26S proteasome regulatory subunit
MNLSKIISAESAQTPFEHYDEYVSSLFAAVDSRIQSYIDGLMQLFATENGGFKNVLYPDIEIAHSLCEKHLADFLTKATSYSMDESEVPNPDSQDFGDLEALFSEFSEDYSSEEQPETTSIQELFSILERRGALTDTNAVSMPLYTLSRKLQMSSFTMFCFACAILSSTQTNYASIFQVVNQNGSLSAPTVESAARIYFGSDFSMTGAYGEMSLALEQLAPVIDLKINAAMPFSTSVSPDKHLIDYLFGTSSLKIDELYTRFFTLLTDGAEPDPLIANSGILDALTIAYDDGTRIFSLWGDEGAGRRLTIQHFCQSRGLGCISIDGGKLFAYDFSFVEKALWALSRECVLMNACCSLSNLSYREDEKEKFFGYMDLAFEKLTERSITVFTVSAEKLPLKQMTTLEFAQLELPTPNNQEREDLWNHYVKDFSIEEDVDLSEMATKFLFTGGKIKSALRMGKSLSAMAKHEKIVRTSLFEACYNQMSHELTQKATKIKATYTWDDIVMSKDQRQALEYACDQMRFRKQVYEQWDYNRKYPYGRGLSVLLFGAPGTGKSMCAQVIANALNLELYRVDLSKVVDKYVGETEKSISMIFREAKKCNVVLFFDECDTLFAKRSDDGGSSQSSNNNKTALLLQEVEAYDGVSVLATNYKHNIDPAFFRRMKFIVEFQFPDPETRYTLWKTTIPKSTPLAEDVDIRFLADRFEFVGGNIKNCILNAAFLAAADGSGDEVHMKHYLQAIRYEFVKTGKVFTRSDFEPYADLIL